MKIPKKALFVVKNSVALFVTLFAFFSFVAYLVPDYQARYGQTTAIIAVGIAIGFLLGLLTVLYTKLTTTS